MSKKTFTTIDGNEAAAYVMYRVNEVCGIYPITPSSNMSEWCDEWANKGIKNIWGQVPTVVEMQSEAGAAGTVHGSLLGGALTTTFTASQGLLLKIPNMFKIAGELTPTVFNIAARTIATHGLSIFGDHSDIMAARSTGFAFLAANSVQEVMDMALVAQASTLESRIPFVHFFDGFRTSHEVAKIELISEDVMREMITDELVNSHKQRGLNPDKPFIRGTSQNPDVYFQNRERANEFYANCPAIVQKNLDKLAQFTGRKYKLYEYYGDPNAEHIIVMMGSAVEPTKDTIDYLMSKGEKVGVVAVRLYRPLDLKLFNEAIPASVKFITVLDRTKEPGATGEPLYTDTVAAIFEGINKGYSKLTAMPKIIGGRYGLSSKEYTPAMIKAVYDNMNADTPKEHFTVGINDDVTHTSLDFDPNFDIEADDVVRAMFYGLGSDGTVGANKNSIKIIGEHTDNYCQGYFVYDSKKAGALTVSHLRFGAKPIRSTYLISKANFIACHQTVFIEKYNMLKDLAEGGIFLLNTPYSKEEAWNHFPKTLQQQIIDKKARVYVIDAQEVASNSGMGRRINTIMQVCFFAISGVLPREEAIEAIKQSIVKSYSRKGDEVVQKNLKAVDHTLENLHQIEVPASTNATVDLRLPVPETAPKFVKEVIGKMIANEGDTLPVSAFPIDGTWPSATTQYEKRGIALQVPVWDPNQCIQCGKCSTVCPHAAIRLKVADPKEFENAPATLRLTDVKDKELTGMKFSIQVSPEDCTGCGVCYEACPVKVKDMPGRKAINMTQLLEIRDVENANYNFFKDIPDLDRKRIKPHMLKSQQLQRPLFEFSGACAGCGETPYLKMLSQLFGDRAIVANATGCSSIYGGNLPTTPWAQNKDGRGPAWANSLFEDNAEFGLGIRLAVNKHEEVAKDMLKALSSELGDQLVGDILNASQANEIEIQEQRERVAILKTKLSLLNTPTAKNLLILADYLVKKSVWIVGGDGWAYDIGFGGLDHIFSLGENVNILVLDTEVYSNTGGQSSKSTPIGAVAKFASQGKKIGKKDLGLIAMSYRNVYVASVALGANDAHTLKAFNEAEAYNGTSLIIAYSHCIAHGIDMSNPLARQKSIVDSGKWLLYRFNPDLVNEGKKPMQLDSKEPKLDIETYMAGETRFNILKKTNPQLAAYYVEEAQKYANERYEYYRKFQECGL